MGLASTTAGAVRSRASADQPGCFSITVVFERPYKIGASNERINNSFSAVEAMPFIYCLPPFLLPVVWDEPEQVATYPFAT